MAKTEVKKTGEAFVSLYRKYRPSNFSDVVGQEQVVSVLEQSIKQGKLAHAYLFCGSRGTGKTSIARIFARAIGTTANDLYEIDAASNTSVEDIRQLNEAVNTIPFESPYKVYILDEVHMLSKSAFNAFLKTLEEPPKHVIFILATTEMEKLPDTIVSRCQTFVFKKPTAEMLKDVVVDISKKEGVKMEGAASELVALLGDGSFRDTLSILQKVVTLASDKAITLDEVEKVTGAPKSALVLSFVEAITAKDIPGALSILGDAAKEHIDIKVFNKLILARLRYLLLRLAAPAVATSEASAGVFTADEISRLNAIKVDQGLLVKTLYAFLDASTQMGKSHIATLPLELAVVKLSV